MRTLDEVVGHLCGIGTIYIRGTSRGVTYPLELAPYQDFCADADWSKVVGEIDRLSRQENE
ncbi:hypothetical protein GCM10027430_36050 [Lysobacter tyrosinilyticus]